tara:strand:- start:4753 stop:5442 length:690 start_codon:yes stop_codon:yes gene_type:complete
MLIIHQRKSAGTSLIHTLAREMDLEVAEQKISQLNAKDNKLHKFLEKFEKIDSQIMSTHMHPTKKNMEWVISKNIKCVILLRNPKDSYEALYRHREENNEFLDVNVLAKKREPHKILEEFYHNWGSLRHNKNILIIFYEELIFSANDVFDRIFAHYSYSRKTHYKIELEKKRYSGSKKDKGVPKIPPVEFKENLEFIHNPDFKGYAHSLINIIKYKISKLLNVLGGKNF